MRDHKAIFEMTHLVGNVRDQFADTDQESSQDRVLAAIHDTLLWVSKKAVPNMRVMNYLPDPDN